MISRTVIRSLIFAAAAAHGQAAQHSAATLNGEWQIAPSIQGNDASDACNLTTDQKRSRRAPAHDLELPQERQLHLAQA